MPDEDERVDVDESICVFTAVFGRYDSIVEQPVAQRSGARFVCFTDDPALTSETWEIRLVEPTFAADPVRSARMQKILGPHVDFDFTVSLYIDASVRLRATPEELVAAWLTDDVDMALPVHSYRENLIDEFDEVIRLNYDDRARVYEQLSDYAEASPDVLEARPHWTAILIRRNREPVARAMRVWADHVLRYSRRDQLSVMAALGGDIAYRSIDIDNFGSPFHQWPVIEGRRIAQGKAPVVPPGPTLVELRRAHRRADELEKTVEELQPDRVAELRAEIDRLGGLLAEVTDDNARVHALLREKTRQEILADERVRVLESRPSLTQRIADRVLPRRFRR